MPCDGRWSSVCLCWLKVLLLQFHIHIARSKYWCLILQSVNIGWEGLFQSTIRKIHSTVQEILYSFISSKATFTKTTQHNTTIRTTGRKTMGCILALSKTHMAASTTRSRCKFVCYPRLPDIKLQLQVQSTSRGCHPEKPSIMKGQPGNHTVLVGSNLTLPCELMVSVIKSKS